MCVKFTFNCIFTFSLSGLFTSNENANKKYDTMRYVAMRCDTIQYNTRHTITCLCRQLLSDVTRRLRALVIGVFQRLQLLCRDGRSGPLVRVIQIKL